MMRLFRPWLLLLFAAPALAAQTTDTVHLPGSDISFTMVNLPGGTYSFGEAETPVTLSPFAISSHEVTHDAYRLFQVRENDSPEAAAAGWDVDAVTRPSPPYLDLTYGMGTRGGYPQVNTTQQAALRYCEWLYEKTGRFFRLPTEAEWEYACVAGQEPDPADLQDLAWLYENGEETYHPTGLKQPNPWGLYDMIGNVSEWTLDEYYDDYSDRLNGEPDPWMRPDGKHSRTVRGGSFDTETAAAGCRVREKSSPRWQARDPQIPKSRWWNVDSPFLGFRLVSPAQQPSEEEVRAFFAEAIID
ncbi:formylglycine-generating enzyme required for sulfatase activity [Lewinella marina]|uniref:Sulfatase-modifying factor n=1 Tax=Neolewinella marina TaxID=438751 RepID=A0A2G0CJM8_9BACT|nr:SUMF1/EgtB/PvdO family nonheme iron enzyme [Neolewinella marina]NJB84656.1 formylglycine-generating enzyme required for sulfatase activity [Neolewinella marina]PHL00172.1 sulfatase-modifying factor [Neolewinella marina]